MRPTAAAILAFASLGKVFSPQYAIWLLPYLVAMDGPIAPRARRLFLVAVVLTLLAQALIGPFSRTSWAVIASLNVKDMAWMGLLAMLARRLAVPQRPKISSGG